MTGSAALFCSFYDQNTLSRGWLSEVLWLRAIDTLVAQRGFVGLIDRTFVPLRVERKHSDTVLDELSWRSSYKRYSVNSP